MSEEELLRLATEAYIFGYPLVSMDMTRRVMTNKLLSPMGHLYSFSSFPTPNILNRYNLSSRSKFNYIIIQHKNPGLQKEAKLVTSPSRRFSPDAAPLLAKRISPKRLMECASDKSLFLFYSIRVSVDSRAPI